MLQQKQETKTPVTRYRLGNPFVTGAVTLGESNFPCETLNHLQALESEKKPDGTVVLSRAMTRDTEIFGLGQTMGNVNKRGARCRMYAIDDFQHTPEKESLYGSHPFFIWKSKTEVFGVFVDYPGEVIFDVGFSDSNKLTITTATADLDVYFIQGSSLKDITKTFLHLVGKPFLPPRWSFGYHQSRWGYVTQQDVESIVAKFETHQIPLDAVYLDLDYMDDFKVFTISEERFPKFKNMISSFKTKGIRVAPIIDPGVKIEKGYEVYEQGMEQGLFITDKDGKPFQASVWPGLTHFPDFLNPKARAWWGAKYKMLHDMGIDGFWNDMNEPAIFYSPEGLEKSVKTLVDTTTKDKNLGIKFLFLVDEIKKSQNSREDMKAMYHQTESQGRVSQDLVHNLFGMKMAESVKEGYDSFAPDVRYHLLSRSTYIGQHRFSGMWTGDNASWWEHLKLNIQHMCSLGLCGFYYAGADIGGFSYDSSGELLTRWNQLAVYMPLFRNHSNLFCKHQEPWAFDSDTLNHSRNSIRFRYALLPYLYSSYVEALESSEPPIRMLGFDFEADARARSTEDQFLCGSSLLAAPILANQARGRVVYLPETHLHWNVESLEERSHLKILPKGDHYVEAPLGASPLFLRENTLLPLAEPGRNSDSFGSVMTVLGLVTDAATFTLHWDDGQSKSLKEKCQLKISVKRAKDALTGHMETLVGQVKTLPWRSINFEIYGLDGKVQRFTKELV
ncbi:MAG: TIM-barrel domain-containing protein [Pseudomonadota bacterium]